MTCAKVGNFSQDGDKSQYRDKMPWNSKILNKWLTFLKRYCWFMVQKYNVLIRGEQIWFVRIVSYRYSFEGFRARSQFSVDKWHAVSELGPTLLWHYTASIFTLIIQYIYHLKAECSQNLKLWESLRSDDCLWVNFRQKEQRFELPAILIQHPGDGWGIRWPFERVTFLLIGWKISGRSNEKRLGILVLKWPT